MPAFLEQPAYGPGGPDGNGWTRLTLGAQYILDECWIMASVDLPVESFLVGAGVNVLTSALALRKKTEQEKRQERMHGPADYPVFMAVAEKVGHDRRGKPLHVRDGHGNLVASRHEETDQITVRGVANLRT